MPARKGNAKRGKTATKTKTEDVVETSEQKLTEKNDLDATFLVPEKKDIAEVVNDGLSNIEDGDESEDQKISGNGDASEPLDKNVEEDGEVQKVSSKKIKGRPKAATKKNESPLSKSVDDCDDEDVELSPKRSHDEDSEQESVKEPPAKRNRGKKVPVPKKGSKAKDEVESVANDDDGEVGKSPSEESDEEAVVPESSSKRDHKAVAVKKGRKGKEEDGYDKSEEKLIKKKGRPAKGSSEKDDDIEGVAVSSKTTKKRVAAVPEPSTRPVRIRKPVVYEETDIATEEDGDVTAKKSKKVVPKKAAAKKTAKPPAKKKGKGAEEVPQEEIETDEE